MNRRSFLRTTGVTAGAAALIPAGGILSDSKAATKHAASPGQQTTYPGSYGNVVRRSRLDVQSTLAPWSPTSSQWNVETISHLYRRAGFGATLSEIQKIQQLSPSVAVDNLLDDKWIQNDHMPSEPEHAEDWLHVPPYLGSDLQTIQKQQTDYYYAIQATRNWWTALMAQPDIMLREKMVLFWSNHFVVEQQKVYYPQMLYNYLDYFRHHPWGNFKQMVKDVTILPAMLIYLDGASSQQRAPNENYARELQELFTLGVMDKNGNPNYTETDIHLVAKALTGYTIDYAAPAPNVLPAIYDVGNHDSTLKSPWGAPAKQYGLASSGHAPDDIIDALFEFRGDALARFICTKLYQFFVYHDVSSQNSQDVIDQMATIFKNNNWELKPVIATLLKSEHFFDPTNIGAAIKSPKEHMLIFNRQLDIPVTNLSAGTMWYYDYEEGMSLLDPPNVKGWPGYRSWISTTTLPMRNNDFAALIAFTGTSPVIGGTGYNGETDTAVQWSDSAVLAWGSQFADYKGDLKAFIDQVADFLCALKPNAAAQLRIFQSLGSPQSYEWPALMDSLRTKAIRAIVAELVVLPEYQLA